LVGAAHNGERTDLLILYEFGDFNLTDRFAPVWARDKDDSGFALGSAGVLSGDGIQRTRRSARRRSPTQN